MNVGQPFIGWNNKSLFGNGKTITKLMVELPDWLLKWGKNEAGIKYKTIPDESWGAGMRTITKCAGAGPNDDVSPNMNCFLYVISVFII